MNVPTEILCSALEEILETMYFCEATWAGPGRIVLPAIGAAVTFSGTCCGEFRILATSPLATKLAADFIVAETSEIAESLARATILEFANVACGATLGAWNPDGDFDLSVPRLLCENELRGGWPHRFSIDGGPEELGAAVELRA
jgi:CheY-specific phosphatase CheX